MHREASGQRYAHQFRQWLRLLLLSAACVTMTCFLFTASSIAQSETARPKLAITLDPPTGWDLQEHAFDAQGNRLPEAPANFRRFGDVRAGEIGSLHTLTLRFAESVSLTQIKSTKDFRIEKGGSCAEGGKYEANTICTVMVRFTPQGPGNRVGRLAVAYSGSDGQVIHFAFGLGGNGYSPVISFIPSVITTVPGTYPSSVGLLSGAQNMWIDGSDSLYVADTGNNLIRFLDSGGSFRTLASGLSAPLGITVDNFGEVYFSEPAADALYEIWTYGLLVHINGTGTGACTVAAPCAITSEAVASQVKCPLTLMEIFSSRKERREQEGWSPSRTLRLTRRSTIHLPTKRHLSAPTPLRWMRATIFTAIGPTVQSARL